MHTLYECIESFTGNNGHRYKYGDVVSGTTVSMLSLKDRKKFKLKTDSVSETVKNKTAYVQDESQPAPATFGDIFDNDQQVIDQNPVQFIDNDTSFKGFDGGSSGGAGASGSFDGGDSGSSNSSYDSGSSSSYDSGSSD